MRRRPRRIRSWTGNVGHVFAEETDPPRGRRKIAGDGVEQRGLAGAVGAEHGAPLAGADPKVDVGERDERAELPPDAFQFQRVGAGRRKDARRLCCAAMTVLLRYLAAYLQFGLSRLADAELEEVGFRNAERLVDRRHHLDDLVVEMAVVGLGDFGQVVVGDRLAVLVELDLAGRRVELELGQRVAELDLARRRDRR